jgi:hypothetical protein
LLSKLFSKASFNASNALLTCLKLSYQPSNKDTTELLLKRITKLIALSLRVLKSRRLSDISLTLIREDSRPSYAR